MKYTSDHYAHIGEEHIVAGKGSQDHALSVEKDGVTGVVISDDFYDDDEDGDDDE
jgi:hypothetical protein